MNNTNTLLAAFAELERQIEGQITSIRQQASHTALVGEIASVRSMLDDVEALDAIRASTATLYAPAQEILGRYPVITKAEEVVLPMPGSRQLRKKVSSSSRRHSLVLATTEAPIRTQSHTSKELMTPVLNALNTLGGSAHRATIFRNLLDSLPLVEKDFVTNQHGTPRFHIQAGFALTTMKQEGLVTNENGVWQLTRAGQKAAQATQVASGQAA